MGLLDWLLGRPQSGATTPTETPVRSQVAVKPRRAARVGREPFDIIAGAQDAWGNRNARRAEELFKRGIEAYRRREPDGVDFALGRYGAFLVAQNRRDEAIRVLEEAVKRKTDIPAIWSDYCRLLADARNFEAFMQAIERMTASVRYRIESEFLLAFARRASREDAHAFAEAVARWVVERATGQGNQAERWASIGDLGRILERADRLDEALRLWRDAFDEGSTDPDTANRLSMHLESGKDYVASVAVIRTALTRGLPANVEEALRKRLVRCESKIGKTSSTGARRRSDVTAYSVRHASTAIEPIFQLRVRPSVKDLELVEGKARCLLATKDSSTLVDVDLASGTEVRRVEHLPVLGDAWFTEDGRGIGIRRTAAIGRGPTLLRFLDVNGQIVAESSVPDATSEIALGSDLWYVGCRDGFLYGFELDGRQRWAWKTPGSQQHDENPYFRPCPYYVGSRQSFAAVASMANIYAVGADGKTRWHIELPNERQTRWSFTVPFEGKQGGHEAYGILGLSTGAAHDEVKSAYRRLALATHPDRNPDDPVATAKFAQVQGAYERILLGESVGDAAGMTVTVEMQGFGPMASCLAANDEGVVVGSSHGRLYLFDVKGRLRLAHVLGEGPVWAALRPDGSLGAAWCDNTLLFFRDNKIVNAVEAPDWSRALTMLGEDVVVWRGKHVHLMDPSGRLLWSVEFSKKVTGVAAHHDTLVCAAGVLTAFRRV